ncbi:Protein CBG19181 [Caenorhabditis briggsae]|uniref:Protein CBG19181 n=1 Tax=Caenorhabditis briggsae TaxID=6238 RepID=A8XV08_CAEBR|nr:Protein CBG19181 [Caenorhabditis briggsae]CAP36475.2 Protein CBG19181 [Caenorhabditis briggsae]
MLVANKKKSFLMKLLKFVGRGNQVQSSKSCLAQSTSNERNRDKDRQSTRSSHTSSQCRRFWKRTNSRWQPSAVEQLSPLNNAVHPYLSQSTGSFRLTRNPNPHCV